MSLEGGIDTVRSLEQIANQKSLVIEAAADATRAIDARYDIGETSVTQVIAAVENMVVGYESTTDHANIMDLKLMAYDAAEGVLRQLGYDQEDLVRDLLNGINARLGHPNSN